MDRNEIIRKIRAICAERNVRLLYAVFFGSTLYGTATKNSDTDVKGIFLPSVRDLLLGRASEHLRFSTGPKNGKNDSSDIDIELWSARKWLLSLLPAGDTGSIDLLFSPSNAPCVLFRDIRLNPVFENPLKFINFAGSRGYAGYAISQARKYGIKGSRLGAIKKVADWLSENHFTPDKRLSAILDDLVKACADDRYCMEINCNGERSLLLCGKTHMGGISVYEFWQRVNEHVRIYGQRAEEAMRGEGIDWKAISHGVRALNQIIELAETGEIKYPLKSAPELLEIKLGKVPWPEASKIIIQRLDQANEAYNRLAKEHSYGAKFVEDIVAEILGADNPNLCLMDEKAAAGYLGVSQKSMQAWRSKRTGPAYVRLARKCIRYRESDLRDFVDKRVVRA